MTILDPCFLGGVKRVKEGESFSPSWELIFIHIVGFPWPFVSAHLNHWEGGCVGLTNLFPRNRRSDLAEARGSSTGHINLGSSKPTDEINGLKTKNNLKLQVYFKIIAYKSKTKLIEVLL